MKRKQLIISIFSIAFLLTCIFLYNYKYNKTSEAPSQNKSFFREIESSAFFIEAISETESLSENVTESIFEIGIDVESESISEILIDSLTETLTEESSENINLSYPTSERIIYRDNFYYEPLSEEIIRRIYGISYKEDCPIPYEELRYVSVLHYDFYGSIIFGELICNQSIAQDIVEIFYSLYEAEYPIEKMILIDNYMADDKLSMIDNNTSCFNYRTVEGTDKISKHGLGMAIDINPFYNPYVSTNSDGSLYVSPPGSEAYINRNLDFDYKITENDLCYKLFTAHGFKWGGNYKTIKDYQHFYKE